jgi:hypothetical protein
MDKPKLCGCCWSMAQRGNRRVWHASLGMFRFSLCDCSSFYKGTFTHLILYPQYGGLIEDLYSFFQTSLPVTHVVSILPLRSRRRVRF